MQDKELTPFQQKVLRAICKIPKGEVRTYKWVAQKIGSPDAARAVGQALATLRRRASADDLWRTLAKNPYPVKIPCHRVVASDGSLGGYSGRGGVKRKLELLWKERFCGKVKKI